MAGLEWYQYALIAVVFVWSGFVRSGLGFGGAVLSLPFLLLIHNAPLVYLPLIAVHLLVFSSLAVFLNNRQQKNKTQNPQTETESTVNWHYLKYALAIMIIPKLIGVFGLITLPNTVMSTIIFSIVTVYAVSYIFNRPFNSKSKTVDALFLIMGGYISGTSLIGAPLIIAVLASHVNKHQLRNTLFVLWFILVSIKMASFIYFQVDLQLIHHLWLLPCAGLGHIIGQHFHQRMLQAESAKFFRVVGIALLCISMIGLVDVFWY